MTGALDALLPVLPLAAPAALRAEDRNVLRYPPGPLPAVRAGTLVHPEGGLVTDARLRPRVSVLLGPGATFAGVADTLGPVFAQAAAGGAPAAPAAPTREELARALVVYSRNYLPAGTWVFHQVGLHLPLPVEIDNDGAWIVNGDTVRELAGSFAGGWRPRLTTAPGLLDVPDPFVLAADADALIAMHPPADESPAELAEDLWGRLLRNPFAEALLVLAVLRQLPDAATCALVGLATLDGAVSHQTALLGFTRAGNGVLRRLEVLLAQLPAGTDAERVDRVRALLDSALREGPAGQRTLIAHQDLPETPGQLASRGTLGVGTAGGDPPGGFHRLVVGYDIAVGRLGTQTIKRVSYVGPAYTGRLDLAGFLAADANRINPGNDARVQARLDIVGGIAANEGQLDAVRARGRGAGLRRAAAVVRAFRERAAGAAVALQERGARRVRLLLRAERARRPTGCGARRALSAAAGGAGRHAQRPGLRRPAGLFRRNGQRGHGSASPPTGSPGSGCLPWCRRLTGGARSWRRWPASTASARTWAASTSVLPPSRCRT